MENNGVDSLLRGLTVNLAQEIDNQVVDDVRNFLFGPPGSGGFDLASLNIQRGRDHGLSDYNSTRVALGLDAVENFSDITSDPDIAARLEQLYGTVDNIDLWVGGLAEDHIPGSSMGVTFSMIIIDQFQRLRDGDRFWYENVFSGEALNEINNTTLADVIERNSEVSGLQENVFFAPTVMQIDLAETGTTNVTISAKKGILQVVDHRTKQVLGSQPLDNVERLMLTSPSPGSLHINFKGIKPADLPGGLIVEAGKGRDDALVIHGTQQSDTIVVNENVVEVNNLPVEFTGVERIVIQHTNADDSIQVADDVDIDVNVLDMVRRDSRHDGPPGREQPPHQNNHRPSQGPDRQRANERDAGKDRDDLGMLDAVFASSDLGKVLDMSPGKRRR